MFVGWMLICESQWYLLKFSLGLNTLKSMDSKHHFLDACGKWSERCLASVLQNTSVHTLLCDTCSTKGVMQMLLDLRVSQVSLASVPTVYWRNASSCLGEVEWSLPLIFLVFMWKMTVFSNHLIINKNCLCCLNPWLSKSIIIEFFGAPHGIGLIEVILENSFGMKVLKLMWDKIWPFSLMSDSVRKKSDFYSGLLVYSS